MFDVTGAGIGGMNGLYNGFRETAQLTGAVRRTQYVHHSVLRLLKVFAKQN